MPKLRTGSLNCMHGPENTFTLSSPIGDLELICCAKGVHALNMSTSHLGNTFKPNPDTEVKIIDKRYDDNGYTYKSALDCVQWLNTYFHKLSNVSCVHQPDICHFLQLAKGSKSSPVSFTTRVWYTLLKKVPVGQTVSYGRLALLSGSTAKASRAVGQAMRTNPVMIIIPCHRVILGSGAMGNYASGKKNDVKAWLLKHESVQLVFRKS